MEKKYSKTALQGAGLVRRAKKRGKHRKRRPRRPMTVRYGAHIVGRYTAYGQPIVEEEKKKAGPTKKKRAMEPAAAWKAEEKPENGFPTAFHPAWKTRSKERSEFPTVPTAPTA